MLKIFTLFLTLIANNFFYEPDKPELMITPCDEIAEEMELYDIYGDYKIYLKDNRYYIINGNIIIDTEFYDEIIVYNNKIYLSYWYNNEIYIKIYNLDGVLNEVNKVDCCDFLNEYKFMTFNNVLYIIGTSYNESDNNRMDLLKNNIVLYDIANKQPYYFGGIEDEEFIDYAINDNDLYVCIKKDKITYGDFGNGGSFDENITVFKLNCEMEIINVNVFNFLYSSDLQIVYKENLFLIDGNIIIKCDDNLKIIISKINYNENKEYWYIGDNYLCCFEKKKIMLYSLEFVSLKHQIDFSLENIDLIIFNERIVIKDVNNIYYDFDIIDFTFFQEKYEKLNINNEISSLYGNVIFIEEKYESYYNNYIFGNYEYELTFRNYNDVYFTIYGIKKIELITNVIDGMVYPVGYRLIFNGEAYLDGKLIINNYSVTELGSHKLIIYGKEEVCEKEFLVKESGFEYNDMIYSSFDIKTTINSNFDISLNVNGLTEDVIITDVIANMSIEKIAVGKEVLTITFKGKDTVCKDILYIERALCISDNKEYQIIIEKLYNVIFCYPYSSLNIGEINEKLCMDIELLNNTAQLRGLEILFENNEHYYNYIFLLDKYNKRLTIDNIKEGVYNLSFYIIIYNLDGYERIKLFELEMDVEEDSFDLGSCISCYYDEYATINLSLDEKYISQIKKIYYNGDLVFSNYLISIWVITLVSIVCLCVSVIIGFVIRKKYFYKR